MKIYLVDDDKSVLTIMKMIIEDRNLGEVCGTCSNGLDALDDINYIQPDMVIVDLLMPEMDGITFVRKSKFINPDIAYIMLSQVSSKDMIANAYESGVEFFIQKPINSVEVENVLKNVMQTLAMNRTLHKMQHIFQTELHTMAQSGPDPNIEKPHIATVRTILQKLGIIGDLGSKDIILLVDYLVSHDEYVADTTLNDLCSKLSDNPKSVEQRIRRTALSGMVNLAHLGIEDYANEIFMEYSNSLYNFVQVRREMDYIRGKSSRHGNVKIKNFLNSLVTYSQN